MRRYNINSDWKFRKGDGSPAAVVTLPHIWDIRGGQNGNGGYVGVCVYEKQIEMSDDWKDRDIYLEIGAAGSVAEVVVNGQPVGTHKGGYSLFRFNITKWMRPGQCNRIEVRVDNSVRDDVYPIAADYTFFGGIYRDVNLVVADASRFSLDDDGSEGIYIIPEITGGGRGRVRVYSVVDEPEGCEVCCQVLDQDGELCAKATVKAGKEPAELFIGQPVLWNGRSGAYQYTLSADLLKNGRWMEKRMIRFGFRSIRLSAESGFQLNGERLFLRGVGRHQDREDRGWAISREDMEEDMALLKEIGANTVRLAHYQHAPYFYELCDREGLAVWAEIPFISRLSDSAAARENALLQLTELIKQNYNHPSICFWGIGNDVTMFGAEDWVEEALREMNALAKCLDPGRITVCSHMMTLAEDSPLSAITDGIGYNVYYGWYVGECSDMGVWLDELQQKQVPVPIAISEYGADGILTYQTGSPTRGDYSESYQSLYHEEMLAIIREHPLVWASYVWNLCDFASVNRKEGGVSGRNNKGLVTYDRKTRKDAFYLYKAEWSGEPVVHITGKRYKRRAESRNTIRVYSNAEDVELFVNSKSMGAMCKDCHIFWLDGVVLLPGKNDILVKTERGDYDDVILYGEPADEPSYLFRQDRNAEMREVATEYRVRNGYHSVYDTLDEILDNPEAKKVLEEEAGADVLSRPLLHTLGALPLESIARKSGGLIRNEWVVRLNERLTKVKKLQE